MFNTPIVPTFTLPSGEKNHLGLTTWGTDFGFAAPNPAQSAVLMLGLDTNAPSAYPMTAVNLDFVTDDTMSTTWRWNWSGRGRGSHASSCSSGCRTPAAATSRSSAPAAASCC